MNTIVLDIKAETRLVYASYKDLDPVRINYYKI